MNTSDKKLIKSINKIKQTTPPVWVMRQAGRYLPEYRETRAQAGGFLDLCYNSDLATEVTLQPIRRYGFDASILFADILLVPNALGRDVWFVGGEGPQLNPITKINEIPIFDEDKFHNHLEPVYQTVRNLSANLPAETTLIGFAGAPWTVATYMIAGSGSKDHAVAKKWMYQEPKGFETLLNVITKSTIEYLSKQIEAGAEVIKIFDSWAGSLPAEQFRKYCIEPCKEIRSALKLRHPDVPVIGFPRLAGSLYPEYARETNIDCLAIDQSVDRNWINNQMKGDICLQGNLDPVLLAAGGEALRNGIDKIKSDFRDAPYIFNLGHGITPDIDPDVVHQMVEHIRK